MLNSNFAMHSQLVMHMHTPHPHGYNTHIHISITSTRNYKMTRLETQNNYLGTSNYKIYGSQSKLANKLTRSVVFSKA